MTPLAAFGVYFGLWHAVRHTAGCCRWSPRGRAPRAGAGLRGGGRGAAVLALGALGLVARAGAADASEPLVSAGLGVLLALTFPHVGVVAMLDRSRRGRCRQRFGRSAHWMAISPVVTPAESRIVTATSKRAVLPASRSASTSSRLRPRVASAVTSPIASLR